MLAFWIVAHGIVIARAGALPGSRKPPKEIILLLVPNLKESDVIPQRCPCLTAGQICPLVLLRMAYLFLKD